MIAARLISAQLLPLKPNDSVETAGMLMQDYHVPELPVVDQGEVVGYLSADRLFSVKGNQKVSQIMNPNDRVTLDASLHLFEIVRLFSENNWMTRAVTTESKFTGILSATEILNVYKGSALVQPGGIIELVMHARNYSLAEISRLVESNEAKILHLLIIPVPDDSEHIRVTIKLNTREVRNILLTFERFQYQVTGVYMANGREDDFKSRFDNLMHYLNS